MIELSARILALEAIVRTLVSEQTALGRKDGKGSGSFDRRYNRAQRRTRHSQHARPWASCDRGAGRY